MKKFACFLLALVLFGLCACEKSPAVSSQPEVPVSSAPAETPSAPASSAPAEYIPLQTDALYIRADSYDGESFSALFPIENANAMAISAVHHLPVLRFQTETDFTSRVKELKHSFQLDVSYDEAGSFTEQTAAFDEAFFEENDLLVVYVSAYSGSIRHEVTEASVLDGECLILVEELRPEEGTDDMADWFILLEVPKAALENCRDMDAILTGGNW